MMIKNRVSNCDVKEITKKYKKIQSLKHPSKLFFPSSLCCCKTCQKANKRHTDVEMIYCWLLLFLLRTKTGKNSIQLTSFSTFLIPFHE